MVTHSYFQDISRVPIGDLTRLRVFAENHSLDTHHRQMIEDTIQEIRMYENRLQDLNSQEMFIDSEYEEILKEREIWDEKWRREREKQGNLKNEMEALEKQLSQFSSKSSLSKEYYRKSRILESSYCNVWTNKKGK